MTSDPGAGVPGRAFVWTWLPGAGEPVVAGVITRTPAMLAGDPVLTFTYAASYRERENAVPLYTPELPLRPGTFDPSRPGTVVVGSRAEPVSLPAPYALTGRQRSPLEFHGCLRDAAPDAWGRRVLNARLADDPDADLGELTYLLASGSDRIGGLDFQASATEYVPRDHAAPLEQLVSAADFVERGANLPAELALALQHGTSIGGARPKALLRDGHRSLIAKFSSSTDVRPVVKAEAVAMILARRAGVDAAPVELRRVEGRDVLLVERFDRPGGGVRRHLVSALTVLGYSAMGSRHASYPELAAAIRTGPWATSGATLAQLFRRMIVNVCVGNTDDHLRNHAAFWDGERLALTPAYDIAPQPRSTSVASHAIALTDRGERAGQLRLCQASAGHFLLSTGQARQVIDEVVDTIRTQWADACDEATLTRGERAQLWGREILNDYVFFAEP